MSRANTAYSATATSFQKNASAVLKDSLMAKETDTTQRSKGVLTTTAANDVNIPFAAGKDNANPSKFSTCGADIASPPSYTRRYASLPHIGSSVIDDVALWFIDRDGERDNTVDTHDLRDMIPSTTDNPAAGLEPVKESDEPILDDTVLVHSEVATDSAFDNLEPDMFSTHPLPPPPATTPVENYSQKMSIGVRIKKFFRVKKVLDLHLDDGRSDSKQSSDTSAEKFREWRAKIYKRQMKLLENLDFKMRAFAKMVPS
ncbi:uncharacterized protein V2V93DRAFT_368514 [Kockiozyma suomiensis]|uniref:uncharacterized protein n=1 Tax=Kockiozyma suomiensis TaxID=1337062 RepID=UPI003343775D